MQRFRKTAADFSYLVNPKVFLLVGQRMSHPLWYTVRMIMIEVTSPDKKVAALALAVIRARVNKDGLMGSASREHKVKKGKGSFRRREKHQKRIW